MTKTKETFVAGFKHLTVKRTGVLNCPSPRLGARLEVDCDLTPLFPLINAHVADARYLEKPERVQFVFDGIQCTLYAQEIIAAAFSDREQAVCFGNSLLELLNSLYRKRKQIRPNFRKHNQVPVFDIYKILPKTNCGKCGQTSCLAFAGSLSSGRADISLCPDLGQPITEKAVFPVLDNSGNLQGTVELDLPETSAENRFDQEQSADSESDNNLISLLTEREQQVLKLVALGCTNPQISEKLFISPHTVKTHVVHIYEKLGVNDRTQAAVIAARNKLI